MTRYSYISISADYLLLTNNSKETISAFKELRFLKLYYVSIVALLPCPEGLGDSRYSFIIIIITMFATGFSYGLSSRHALQSSPLALSYLDNTHFGLVKSLSYAAFI